LEHTLSPFLLLYLCSVDFCEPEMPFCLFCLLSRHFLIALAPPTMNNKFVPFRYASPWLTMRRPVSRSPFIWLRYTALGVLLPLVYTLSPLPYRRRTLRAVFSPSHPPSSADSCHGFSHGANVVVSVKTSASEEVEKVPAQIETTLRSPRMSTLLRSRTKHLTIPHTRRS
jgi:hypothetical protein